MSDRLAVFFDRDGTSIEKTLKLESLLPKSQQSKLEGRNPKLETSSE